MKKLKRILIFTLILMLFSISSVCASDLNETPVTGADQGNDLIEIEKIDVASNDEINICAEDATDEVGDNNQCVDLSNSETNDLSANPDGTFTDLANDIANASSGELKLSRNYVYVPSKDSNYANGIVIDKEITIDGQGFTVNGDDRSRAFNVTSDNVILKNIKFSNCNLYNSSNSQDYVASSSSSGYGGAVYWNGNNGALFNCSFVNCNVLSYSSSSSSRSISDKGSSYSYSYTSGYGGAVYWKGDDGCLFDCSFTDCCIISDSDSYSYSYTDGSIFPDSKSYSYSYGYGGAVYWYGHNANILDCSFINCQVSSSASYSCRGFGDFNGDGDSKSSSNGGAIYLDSDDGILKNCIFINSNASSKSINIRMSGGGAVYWNGANGYLDNCSFVNSSSAYDGGAVYWNADYGVLTNSSFLNSHAANDGGAVFWNYEGIIANCSFVNSSCDWEGGAIWGGNTYLYACDFVNSSSQSSSGAIFWDGHGEAYGCSFTHSHTNGSGGALFLRDATLHDCIFVDSSADYSGGAIYFMGGAHLYDCIFTESSANNGGAIYWEIYDYSSGVLTNCSFVNSQAYENGGAILWRVTDGSDGVLANCSFVNSSCQGSGPAIYMLSVDEDCVASLYGCSFDGDYYNYEAYCSGSYKFKPVLTINDYYTFEGDKAIVFGSQPLMYNCTANICNLENESLFNETFIFSSRENLSKECIFNNLTHGAYRVSLHYGGDGLYLEDTVVTTVNVLNIVRIDVDSIIYADYNDGSELVANLTDMSTGNAFADGDVIININGNENSTKTDSKGQVRLSTLGWAPDTYTVTISYIGNSEYDCSTATSRVIVKAYTRISACDLSVRYNDGSQLVATLTNNFTGENITGVDVVISVNGVNRTVRSDSNGQVKLSTSALEIDTYDVAISYLGNDEYKPSNATVKITVKSTITTYDANGTYLNTKVSAAFLNTDGESLANREVTFKVDDKDYAATTDNDGVATANVDLGVGNYTVIAVNPVNNEQKQFKLSINKANSYINLVSTQNNGVTTLTATLTPVNATGNVVFNVSGENKNIAIVNGKAILNINDLEKGNYTVTASYGGDNNLEASNSTITFTVAEKTVIENNTETNTTQETPADNNTSNTNATDATGDKTTDTNATGTTGDKTTDTNVTDATGGKTTDTNVTDTTGDKTTDTNSTKPAAMVDPVISADNVNAIYSAGTYYTIKVTGTDGKPANTVVKITGKISKTLTATNGIAKFKIDQVPGTYKITITSLGKSVTKTITVKHLVTLKTVKVKKSAKKLVLQATLGKVNGKYLKNKKITFKFNGKKYTVKTNKKGVAKLTIPKKVLKKLKVGKKVTYQATYLKDTVKKTVKVKK